MVHKPIRISGHARFEMERRGIRANMVFRTVRSPGQIVPSRKGRLIYQSMIGNKQKSLLRVVVKEDKRVYHVVTVYKTTKITKYWRSP